MYVGSVRHDDEQEVRTQGCPTAPKGGSYCRRRYSPGEFSSPTFVVAEDTGDLSVPGKGGDSEQTGVSFPPYVRVGDDSLRNLCGHCSRLEQRR